MYYLWLRSKQNTSSSTTTTTAKHSLKDKYVFLILMCRNNHIIDWWAPTLQRRTVYGHRTCMNFTHWQDDRRRDPTDSWKAGKASHLTLSYGQTVVYSASCACVCRQSSINRHNSCYTWTMWSTVQYTIYKYIGKIMPCAVGGSHRSTNSWDASHRCKYYCSSEQYRVVW